MIQSHDSSVHSYSHVLYIQQEEEFSLVIDTSSMNLVFGWNSRRWQWDVAADDLVLSPRALTLNKVGSNDEGSKADDEVLTVDDRVEDEDGENHEEDELNSKVMIIMYFPHHSWLSYV